MVKNNPGSSGLFNYETRTYAATISAFNLSAV